MFTLCQSPVASTASPALGKLYTKRKLFHRVRECLPAQISVCCNLELSVVDFGGCRQLLLQGLIC